ncbi:pyridoxal phosphate-dependent aminotransferase [Candidatus Stoquefichus massiliensis]|uniref:pyridoxal phosphate-dependent aminotransferase n=1 Tax=Candidatus Stoquefichus massiliensis TaxID=1470350 RepID=UPI0004AC6075|nr:pyridoxal phosphate-dependent aminotransferase [Candidatus Stoquefichus massiliensis]
MSIKEKMNKRFYDLQGGLFAKVTKADVGEGAGQLIQNGYTVMAWADPFFPDPSIPKSVKDTMIKEIENGFPSHYTMPMGDRKLREVIAKRIKDTYDVVLDPSRHILITPGSDSGLLYAMLPFLSEGDEVLIPDPSYPSNFVNAKLCGATAIHVPLYPENGYQLDISEFEKRVTPYTKMVVITHPNNPTGTVFNRKSILDLCDFVKKRDLILVSDQAFEDHIYDNREMIAPMSIDGMFERTITTFSISKGLGLSGFRVGYIIANDELMDVYYGGAVNVLGATNTLAQKAAITALEDKSIIKDYHERLLRRRDIAYKILNSIPHVKTILPESGILSWIDISELGTSQEVAAYLLDKAHISVNEGTPYGHQGEGYLRIVHACFWDDQDAVKALNKIKDSLIQLGKEKRL